MATAIQFLRSREPQVRPSPVELSDGMPMVNIHSSEPGLYFRLTDNKLAKIGPTSIGPTAPNSGAAGSVGNAKGEMWLDTSGLSDILKVYDGLDWKNTTATAAGLDTQVQFNSSGEFGADPDFTFDGVVVKAPMFEGDGSLLTNLNIPGSLTFRGDCNVTQPAPAASTGDYFLNIVAGNAVSSWSGIVGQSVSANQFVYYTVDDEWALGAVQDSQGLVTISGDQVISGAKTFTASMVADDIEANSIDVEALVVSVSTSAPLTLSTDSDDTLATKSYVDNEVATGTFWDRDTVTSTILPSDNSDGIFSWGNLGVGGTQVAPLVLFQKTGEMTVNGSSDLRGSLSVIADTTIGGSLDVTGDASCDTMTAKVYNIDTLPALF